MEMENIPTPDEIRAQLRHMLGGKRFLANENPARFLALIVDKTLNGQEIRQAIIGTELFHDKYLRGDICDVRVTAKNLRKVLAAYYADEGQEDKVVIDLPKPPPAGNPKLPTGEAYKPRFSYNSNIAAIKSFQLGQFYCARGMHDDCYRAFCCFIETLNAVPSHIGAAIGVAEALCRMLTWEYAIVDDTQKFETIDQAALYLDLADSRAQGYWRLYAVAAFMFVLNNDIEDAKSHFQKALDLDLASTQSFSLYFYSLCRWGDVAEALRLSATYLDSHVTDIAAYKVHADLLFAADRSSEAEAMLEKALDMDRGAYDVHFALAMLRLRQIRPEEALKHLDMLRTLTDELTFSLARGKSWEIVQTWPAEMVAKWWGKFFPRPRVNSFLGVARLRAGTRFLTSLGRFLSKHLPFAGLSSPAHERKLPRQ